MLAFAGTTPIDFWKFILTRLHLESFNLGELVDFFLHYSLLLGAADRFQVGGRVPPSNVLLKNVAGLEDSAAGFDGTLKLTHSEI
jgi:hypothetical protein